MRSESPRELYAWDLAHKLASADPPLIVHVDGDPSKYEKMRIDGALSLADFESNVSRVPKDHEIVFYGILATDESPALYASRYQERGFSRARSLSGGLEAWNAIKSFLRPAK